MDYLLFVHQVEEEERWSDRKASEHMVGRDCGTSSSLHYGQRPVLLLFLGISTPLVAPMKCKTITGTYVAGQLLIQILL